MSETAPMTLSEFLLARIAEDEAVARAASPGGWQYSTVESVGGGALYDETRTIGNMVYEQPEDHDGRIVRHLLEPETDANGAHIKRWDPARVLAECEAKRRIVEDFQLYARDYREAPSPFAEGRRFAALQAVARAALPYADHPDYRDEWRP